MAVGGRCSPDPSPAHASALAGGLIATHTHTHTKVRTKRPGGVGAEYVYVDYGAGALVHAIPAGERHSMNFGAPPYPGVDLSVCLPAACLLATWVPSLATRSMRTPWFQLRLLVGLSVRRARGAGGAAVSPIQGPHLNGRGRWGGFPQPRVSVMMAWLTWCLCVMGGLLLIGGRRAEPTGRSARRWTPRRRRATPTPSRRCSSHSSRATLEQSPTLPGPAFLGHRQVVAADEGLGAVTPSARDESSDNAQNSSTHLPDALRREQLPIVVTNLTQSRSCSCQAVPGHLRFPRTGTDSTLSPPLSCTIAQPHGHTGEGAASSRSS